MTVVTRSTKEQIVLVAERLIADHGVDGVSLRQIGAAAGNGNNSAVQYHFGTKSRLVRAVFQYRVPRLRERRALLVADLRPTDLRGWMECQIRAVLEQSELDGSNYMSFVASLRHHGGREAFSDLPEEFVGSRLEYEAHVRAHLTHLDEPLRTLRLHQAMTIIVNAAADRERARARGEAVLPFAAEVGNLADGVVGFLEAPPSRMTRAALAATGETGR